MKRTLEKAALLALSLILVSTYSISAVVPMMRDYYTGYSDAQVDLLLSVPSFGILVVCLVNAFFAEHLKERPMVIGGLLLTAVLGTLPAFCQNYTFVLASRFLSGAAVGMVNAKAVSVISTRYDGYERTVLLGYRASAESVGNIIMTVCAGVLLLSGWTKAFWIYSFGLPILVLYLAVFGVRSGGQNASDETSEKQGPDDGRSASGHTTAPKPAFRRMSRRSLLLSFAYAAFALLAIGANTSVTLRLSVIIEERNFGTAGTASVVLVLFQIAAIIAGIFYGILKTSMGRIFLPFFLLLSAGCTACICLAPNLVLLGLGAVLFSFCNAALVTTPFLLVSKNLPKEDVDKGTSFVLVGCNCGAFTFPFVVSLVSAVSTSAEAPMLLYGGVMVVIAGLLCVRKNRPL